jgi:hypothetical protein
VQHALRPEQQARVVAPELHLGQPLGHLEALSAHLHRHVLKYMYDCVKAVADSDQV